ncbi:MAG: hypothetical protein AABY48_02980, partial [Nitrospirota bacterium]
MSGCPVCLVCPVHLVYLVCRNALGPFALNQIDEKDRIGQKDLHPIGGLVRLLKQLRYMFDLRCPL